MRTSICLVLFLMLLCTSLPAHAAILTWNEVNDESYGATVGAHVFADKIRELSGGSIEIDLYINGALGSEDASMQGLEMGTLDVFRGNASSLSSYGAEVICATGLPYLFKDMEAFEEMVRSPLGDELLESVEAADCGYVALGWLTEGPRNLMLTQQAYEKIGSPETLTLDMVKGLNIRVPGTEMLIRTMSALGANPIEIAYSELISSLKSGNIDGAENGINTYLSMGFYEAAPYFVLDAHTFGCGVILMSAQTWNSFSEEEKGWLREAGKAASEACYAYNAEQEQKYLARFNALGIKAIPVADLEAWQAACEDLYNEQNAPVQEVVHQIRALNK